MFIVYSRLRYSTTPSYGLLPPALMPNAASPVSSASIPWRENELFQGIPEDVLSPLDPLLETHTFAPGEALMREGELGSVAYLIEEGSIVVDRGGVVLATLGPGHTVGLMGALENAPRSTTVTASDVTTAVALTFDDLASLPEAARVPLRSALLENHARTLSERLRTTNTLGQEALLGQLEEASARAALGQFLANIIVVMCLYGFLLRVVAAMDETTLAFQSTLAFVMLIVLGVVVFFMIRQSPYDKATYGLTWARAGSSVRESLVWTAGFLTVLVAAKWVLLQSVSAFADEPLFDYRLLQIASPQAVLFDAVAYGLYTPIQEFVVRGALQGSLQRTLGGPHVALRAILFSTLIFTTLHLHLSVSYALLTFVPSLFWGAMFARQRSLVGVSLSHVLIGWFVLYVLGLPGLDVY